MGTMHEIAVMDRTGDTKTMWNPHIDDEVEMAKQVFDKFKKKGYAIFRVKADGDKGEQMHTFDKTAEKMICVPPVVGG